MTFTSLTAGKAGGGRKKGAKNEKTLEKERVLAALRQRILKNMNPLFNAAKMSAMGTSYIYRIEKDAKGNKMKPQLVENMSEIEYVIDNLEAGETTFVDQDEDIYYFITVKEPNVQAFKELTDRAFGKTKDSVEMNVTMPKPLLDVLHNNSDKKDL